jgi:hypothetical protein
MEFLIELLLELLIQVFGGVLFELGLRTLAAPFSKESNPWLAAVGYALLGAICGGVSLWPFPEHMVAHPAWRLINLGITPVAAGLSMSLLGAWRAKHGQDLIRIDRFSYGYLFAMGLGLVRFTWAV